MAQAFRRPPPVDLTPGTVQRAIRFENNVSLFPYRKRSFSPLTTGRHFFSARFRTFGTEKIPLDRVEFAANATAPLRVENTIVRPERHLIDVSRPPRQNRKKSVLIVRRACFCLPVESEIASGFLFVLTWRDMNKDSLPKTGRWLQNFFNPARNYYFFYPIIATAAEGVHYITVPRRTINSKGFPAHNGFASIMRGQMNTTGRDNACTRISNSHVRGFAIRKPPLCPATKRRV